MTSITHQCAYCMEHKPYHRKRSLRKTTWGSEHVLPEAICGFKGELTITDYVCSACNQNFGDNHDLWLTRGSIVAVERLRNGMKPLSEISEVDFSRTEVTAKVGGQEIPMTFRWVAGETNVEVEQQVTALRLVDADGKIDYLTVEDIMNRQDLFDLVRNAVEKTSYITDPEGPHRISEALTKRGIIVHGFEDSGIKVEHELGEAYIFDWPVMRAYAKIAFNYFIANCVEMRIQDFLSQEFDPIRAFIRKGDHPGFMPVLPTKAKFSTSTGQKVHVLNQAIEQHPRYPIGRVFVDIFLFSGFGIRVCLTERYRGKMPGFPRARCWFLDGRLCFPLDVKPKLNV